MTVTLDHHGVVGVITLQRENKRNAIDSAMTLGIDDALARLDEAPGLRVGVITGGEQVFSAGTDIAEFDRERTRTAEGGEYGIVRRRRTKPLIAAVEGPALGGGLEVLLACDLVVAGESATFGLPEVALGVVASCGGLFRLQQVVSPMVARELLLLGTSLDARRAHAVGLINRVVPAGTAVPEAMQMARQIAEHAPLAIARTLRASWDALGASDEVAWALSDEAVDACASSDDAVEGRRAFLEGRRPVWSGD